MKTYDIIIIGAGPAGLSAALAAVKSGKRIAILDSNPQSGGQIWRQGPTFATPEIAQRINRQIAEADNIELITAAKVVAAPAKGQLLIELAQGAMLLRYQRLIICAGAREVFIPFPGWTLPGVTGAGGLQALIKAGTPVKNQRVVIAGSGPLLLASADTAEKAGANVVYIAEQASKHKVIQFGLRLLYWPAKLFQALTLPFKQYRPDSYVIEALGNERLEAVRIQTAKGIIEVPCDRLACGYGLTPNTQLGQLLGCQVQQQKFVVDEQQKTSQVNIFAAGECTGFGGSELSMIEGSIAGYAATEQLQEMFLAFGQRKRYQKFADLLQHSFALDERLKSLPRLDTIFCRCEDVRFEQVAQCQGWIDAKLHTRCGMGACQGSTCATAAAYLFGWELPQSRPPLLPTRAKTLTNLTTPFNSAIK